MEEQIMENISNPSVQLSGTLNAKQQLTGKINQVPQLKGSLNNVAMTYESIIGKPLINGQVLVGDLSTEQLKISHEDILDNENENLHPITAITGLQEALDDKETIENVNIKLIELSNNIQDQIVTATKTYVYLQRVPSDSWTINHNLNKVPSVTVIDSAGSLVMGNITYVDENTIILNFSGAFSGKALLN